MNHPNIRNFSIFVLLTALCISPTCAEEYSWFHFNTIHETDNNMSILITSFSGCPVNSEDEVGAYLQGMLVGRGKIESDGRCGIAVWGDDPLTLTKDGLLPGEALVLYLWDSHRRIELPLTLSSGDHLLPHLTYQANDLAIVSVDINTNIPLTAYLFEAYPNPFNSRASVHYGLSESSQVMATLSDATGRVVRLLLETQQPAGHYAFSIDADELSAGAYFITLETSKFKLTTKAIIMK